MMAKVVCCVFHSPVLLFYCWNGGMEPGWRSGRFRGIVSHLGDSSPNHVAAPPSHIFSESTSWTEAIRAERLGCVCALLGRLLVWHRVMHQYFAFVPTTVHPSLATDSML